MRAKLHKSRRSLDAVQGVKLAMSSSSTKIKIDRTGKFLQNFTRFYSDVSGIKDITGISVPSSLYICGAPGTGKVSFTVCECGGLYSRNGLILNV